MDSGPSNHVPAIYVAKYNRFVDTILGRINKILRSNYDPVTVKLTNPNANTKSNKKKNKAKKNKNSTKKGSKNGTVKSAPEVVEVVAAKSDNVSDKNVNQPILKVTDTINTVDVTEESIATTLRSIDDETAMTTQSDTITLAPFSATSPLTVENPIASRATTSTKDKKKNKNKNKTSTKKNKTKGKKNKPKARATLYGLSSLQRTGDVSVNMMSDHTTIKTKFSLGPLILKVEKEFGRSGKKELRSATATTAEMSGKLSLRVLHGGAATLHSIRVLQPKQVRVESADDHDRTREFVWRRSSHIAHVVSQKLSSATKSMLRPPPVPELAA